MVLSAFVDYQWSGAAFVLLAWFGFRTGRALAALAGFVPLCFFNRNLWALAGLPVVVVLSGVRWQLPRGRWAFYGYYVGHLAMHGRQGMGCLQIADISSFGDINICYWGRYG